ncbi:hypothetical protein Sjap_012966 [Stephania japonica]|uniref:Uncharacterized protein n=1 Tax=Stephania japonica TaxID=461633 RepID=A0AAP0IX24_9MAGN
MTQLLMGALMPKTNSFFIVKPNLTCKPFHRKSTILSFSARASRDNIEIPPPSGHGKNSGPPGQTNNYGKVAAVDEVRSSGRLGENHIDFLVVKEEVKLTFEEVVSTDHESSSAHNEEKNEGKKNREARTDGGDDITNLEN